MIHLMANVTSLFSASTAGDLYGVPILLQEHGYRNTGVMGFLECNEEVGYGANPAPFRMLC
jgi:hypothetical protein